MVQVGQMQRLGHLQKIGIFRLNQSPPLDFTIEYLPAELDRCRVLFDAESLANLMTRPSGPDVGQPIPARFRRGRCDDLHCLRILELAREARDAAVDSRALAMETDLGMHRKGEVDGRCTLRQLNHVAGWRKNENLVLI